MALKLEPGEATHRKKGDEHESKPAAAGAGDTAAAEPAGELPPSADPDVEGPPSTSRVQVTTELRPRHHRWLTEAARREGMDAGQYLERLVRTAAARDPFKVRDTRPQALGQVAGSGPR